MARIYSIGPDDWRTWRFLRLRALLDAPHAFGTTYSQASGPNDHETYWRGYFTTPGCNLLASIDHTKIGLARVSHPEAGTDAHLTSLWVAPEARGSGVGQLLVESCWDWLQTSNPGCPLRLSVRRNNLAAQRLYDRLGFTLIGPDPGDATEDVLIRSTAP